MIEVDKGHTFYLQVFDYPGDAHSSLIFMKRKGDKYPGNKDSYPGTNSQEVIRALIARIKYVDNQIQDSRNQVVIWHLRECLYLMEERAAERHNLDIETLTKDQMENIESLPTGRNGHLLIGAGKE